MKTSRSEQYTCYCRFELEIQLRSQTRTTSTLTSNGTGSSTSTDQRQKEKFSVPLRVTIIRKLRSTRYFEKIFDLTKFMPRYCVFCFFYSVIIYFYLFFNSINKYGTNPNIYHSNITKLSKMLFPKPTSQKRFIWLNMNIHSSKGIYLIETVY